MKNKIILISLVLFSKTLLAQTSTPEEAASSIFEEFLDSFTNADIEGIIGLFSEDALFWGTGSKTLVQDTDGIRSYFAALDERGPNEHIATALEHSVLVLSDTDVIVSGMWQIVVSGENTALPLRVSLALSKGIEGWKIVQFHNSKVPE